MNLAVSKDIFGRSGDTPDAEDSDGSINVKGWCAGSSFRRLKQQQRRRSSAVKEGTTKEKEVSLARRTLPSVEFVAIIVGIAIASLYSIINGGGNNNKNNPPVEKTSLSLVSVRRSA